MNTQGERVRALAAQFAGSLTLRTTATIVVFSCLVGMLFAAVNIPMMQRRESARLQAGLEDLASTVVKTVSIACYVSDANLAAEVAQGLLINPSIAAVRIRTNEVTLTDQHKTGAHSVTDASASPIVRAIVSPFDPNEIVGELRLEPEVNELHKAASTQARYLGISIALQAAALAAVVARVVLLWIVRPIKRLSDDLHRLRAEQGEQLALPAGTAGNEIGRLTRDINVLLEKFATLLGSERQQRQDRERSERQLRLIFENAENGIFTLNGHGELLTWNPALTRSLPLPKVRLAGTYVPRLDELLAPHEERVRALIQRCLSGTHTASGDFEIRPGGANPPLWFNVSLQPLETDRLQGIVHDITARKQVEAHALSLAERDMLTGLLNRRGMEHKLRKLLHAYRAGSHPRFALMLLDLDFFKQVNDIHGHDAGDTVLRVVAARLQAALRTADVVARLGGDEFVLILDAFDDTTCIEQLAHRLIAGVCEPIALPNQAMVRIGVSIGIALVTSATATQEALLHSADRAMYAAKEAGRCRYNFDMPQAQATRR